MKLTKEDIDKVRHMEGFPIGTDEDIIALSNPPYYTACPNPFIEDFIEEYGTPYDEETDDYKREPFAADVSEGKSGSIYNAHTYHTKVPHKAIMRYILHYTEPGDIVFDGFCGTGMTGVAAQMCGTPDSDLEFKYKIENEMPDIKWGTRKAILSDLSPAATFIAYNYNTPADIQEFQKEANRILDECEKELGWMYETNHVDENGEQVYDMFGPVKGKINYTVWSEVFICPNCGNELVFWDVAVNKKDKKVKKIFECGNCNVELKKKDCAEAVELIYDDGLNETINIAKQVPMLIIYLVGSKRFEKKLDKNDINTIEKINNFKIPYWYPSNRMIEGSESRRNDKFGITHVHHFFTKRNLLLLSKFNSISVQSKYKNLLISALGSSLTRASIRNRYMPEYGNRHVGALAGTLYVPMLSQENNLINSLRYRLKSIKRALLYHKTKDVIISVNSCENSMISENSIDYIFTDPPFGANINYSELNIIMESWLKVITNNKLEAIINKTQSKTLIEYQNLMKKSFEEYYKVLKPNRWITIVFHNSKNAVWNAIQESLISVGFIIADVRILDKKKGTTNQLTYSFAVKQDLVISAYKPKESFKRKMMANAGTEETAWDFVREHLNKLPIVVEKDKKIEIVTERQAFLLFDRMVAYHIMAGIPVPIDAGDFYKGLDEKFLKRDDMYFLHDQINKYDNARIVSELEPIQFSMFVDDEKNAIAWLYHQLEDPQTYSDIQPKFMKEAKASKHEKLPELGELLEENFLQNSEGKWYIPDPKKAGDIIKLREKRLIKEFDEYLVGKGKLKLFRTEAIRVGFAKLYKDKDYENIVKVGNRLPEVVIQEDDKLLMYYDISLSRME